MKRLGIVPARGGSKRLPGKNIRPLNGKHLICHTIDPAMGLFSRLVVTSDSQEVIDVVKKVYNYPSSIVVDKRPDHLATDTSKVIDTVSYYYDAASLVEEKPFDEIWLLLPTCPLRNHEDIKEAQSMLQDDGVDGVLSITDPEFPPTLHLVETEEGFIDGWEEGHPFAAGNSRSQDQPVTYRPNGALYGMKWKSFGKHRNFYRGLVKGYYMPRERSVDIDTEIDFKLAEAILETTNEN